MKTPSRHIKHKRLISEIESPTISSTEFNDNDDPGSIIYRQTTGEVRPLSSIDEMQLEGAPAAERNHVQKQHRQVIYMFDTCFIIRNAL